MSGIDVSEIFRGLEDLKKAKDRIAGQMLRAGGMVISDEAKRRAPVGDASTGGYSRAGKKGSQQPGTLRDAIYLAYSDRRSDENKVTYSISWNGNAFWGHMQEMGYQHGTITKARGVGGKYRTVKHPGGYTSVRTNGPAKQQKFQGAAFLGSAFDAMLPSAKITMFDAGREAFAEVMREIGR